MSIKLSKSSINNKKFTVEFLNKKTNKLKIINFGAKGYEHYTDGILGYRGHLNNMRRDAYESRHKNNENWNDPATAGYFSYWLLWKFKTYNEAIAYIKNDMRKKGYI